MFDGNGGFGLDIGALLGNMMGRNSGYGMDGGWGGMWGMWFMWIILFALIGDNGWGGLFGGNRNNGGNGNMGYSVPFASSFTDAAVQRGFDNQAILSKLDGITNGICSLGYDQLAQMNGINQNVSTTGYQTRDAISQLGFSMQNIANQNQIADMQRDFSMQRQLSDCCCKSDANFAQARYDSATNTCAITTAIEQAARSIIDNQNCGFRQMHDEQVALQLQGKDAQIASLTRALDKCDTQNIANAAVQSAVAQVRPTAGPAWIVPNPNAPYFGNGNCCNGNLQFGY